jgi:hypothetical protein
VRTELGRSQVEVQRCALSSGVGEELVGKAEVEVEVDADMVEEKLAQKEEEDNSSDKT